jgi:hypothetical protein
MPIGTQQEKIVHKGFGIYIETKIQFSEYNIQIVSDDTIRIHKTLVGYCHSEAMKVQICRSSLRGTENLQHEVFYNHGSVHRDSILTFRRRNYFF